MKSLLSHTDLIPTSFSSSSLLLKPFVLWITHLPHFSDIFNDSSLPNSSFSLRSSHICLLSVPSFKFLSYHYNIFYIFSVHSLSTPFLAGLNRFSLFKFTSSYLRWFLVYTSMSFTPLSIHLHSYTVLSSSPYTSSYYPSLYSRP